MEKKIKQLEAENKRLRDELDLVRQELRHLKYEMAGGMRR